MWKKLLYLGYDKETIKKVRADMDADNIRTVKNVGFLLVILLLILITFYSIFDHNKIRNAICVISVVILTGVCIMSRRLLAHKANITPAIADVLIDMLSVLCFAVAIYLGTFAAKGEMAVPPVWMFFFATLIFNRLPMRNFIVVMLAGICFSICSYFTKESYVFKYDIMHALTSIIASVYVSWPKSRMKVQNILSLQTLQKDNQEIMETVEVQEKEADILRQRMKYDGMTGLYNKVSFEQEAKVILAQSAGHKVKHALLCMDVDDFKSVNDKRGHMAGDDVLRKVGASIAGMFRRDDIAGRFGGDEFVVLVRNIADSDMLTHKVEMLLHRIEEQNHVSLSIGIAMYPGNGTSYGQLFEQADQALYEAKKRGKNRYFSMAEQQ